MELIFVRHGETEFNKHHQLMGQRIDAPLDEKGLKQAHEVLDKIPNDFTMIYSSPLKRAFQTAKIIADYFNKNVEIKQELRERDFGTLSGKTWKEIDDMVGTHISEDDVNLAYDYSQYGGETAQQVKDRLIKFLDEVKKKHEGQTIVVVTHFGIISLMNSMVPHIEHHKLSNISIHKFKI